RVLFRSVCATTPPNAALELLSELRLIPVNGEAGALGALVYDLKDGLPARGKTAGVDLERANHIAHARNPFSLLGTNPAHVTRALVSGFSRITTGAEV